MIKRIFCTCAALAVATPALACPTIEDLGKGIEFRTADGDVELHRQLRPDWVTISVTFSDGDGSILEMFHGMYLQSVIPMESGLPQLGAREDYASSSDLAKWPRPMPGEAWVNPTAGGGRATAGPMETTMIAGCRYNSFEVVVTFADDDSYEETYDYLPDLGLGLLVKTKDPDLTETYSYISVQALK